MWRSVQGNDDAPVVPREANGSVLSAKGHVSSSGTANIVRASALAAACCPSLTACSESEDTSDPQPSPRTVLNFGQSANTAGVLKLRSTVSSLS